MTKFTDISEIYYNEFKSMFNSSNKIISQIVNLINVSNKLLESLKIDLTLDDYEIEFNLNDYNNVCGENKKNKYQIKTIKHEVKKYYFTMCTTIGILIGIKADINSDLIVETLNYLSAKNNNIKKSKKDFDTVFIELFNQFKKLFVIYKSMYRTFIDLCVEYEKNIYPYIMVEQNIIEECEENCYEPDCSHSFTIIKVKPEIILDTEYNSNLDTINLNHMMITQMFDFNKFTSLTVLNISFNLINKLSELPISLTHLYCEGNLLENLDNLPDRLQYLDCSSNNIKNLDKLSNFITYLDCSHNPLTSLDNLPNNLLILKCVKCKLKQLDNLPILLHSLDCNSNDINSIDFLPSNINDISCSENNIYQINNLPTNIMAVSCEHNKIYQFTNIPFGLETIICSHNNLTSFNPNKNIYSLDISNNYVSYLNLVNVYDVRELNVAYNNIVKIDNLSMLTSKTELNCCNNIDLKLDLNGVQLKLLLCSNHQITIENENDIENNNKNNTHIYKNMVNYKKIRLNYEDCHIGELHIISNHGKISTYKIQ